MSHALGYSRFDAWCAEHARFTHEERALLRREALEVLVASVAAGEITYLDGFDSPLSKRIRSFHGSDALELNSNWIGTPQAWLCPCCGRDKFRLSRRGQKRQVLAKLVIHHDHMGEVLKASFRTALETFGTQAPQESGFGLAARIGKAFAAFEEILVCEDCNNADTAAKKLVEAPRSFSFTPGQIRDFVRVRDHAPHEIDGEAVVRIWHAAKPTYEFRIRLIHEVAHAAATNAHWYEPHAADLDPVPVLNWRTLPATVREWISAEGLVKALGPVRAKASANLSRWRLERAARGRSLPSNFLAILFSEPYNAERWNAVDDQWHCPVCRRSKTETVYMKDNRVKFGTHDIRAWGSSPTICLHCSHVVFAIKREVVAAVGCKADYLDTGAVVSANEISSIITPRPNSAHLIDAPRAANLVEAAIRRHTQGATPA